MHLEWTRPVILLGAVAIAASCGKSAAPTSSNGGGNNPPPQAPIGADISALARLEQAGAVYRDSGKAADAIAILRAHRVQWFRLRMFVKPNGQDVQVNDLPYTLALAQRIKAAGGKLLLDLHYSDTWADPGHQTVPSSWSTLPFDSLVLQVRSYTAAVVAALKRAGATPDIVQVGNEIDAGMLWPSGEVGGAYDNATQWSQLAQLLKAAIAGVKDSLAAGDAVQIMLHYSQGADSAGTRWFFDHVNANGVPFDLIGLSYYPFWHGAIGKLGDNLTATAQRYGKDIMIVETSYPWRANGWESFATNTAAMTWPVSASGQAQFLTDVSAAVANTPGGHGRAVFWWYPESILTAGVFIWGGGAMALFDDGGNLLPALSGR